MLLLYTNAAADAQILGVHFSKSLGANELKSPLHFCGIYRWTMDEAFFLVQVVCMGKALKFKCFVPKKLLEGRSTPSKAMSKGGTSAVQEPLQLDIMRKSDNNSSYSALTQPKKWSPWKILSCSPDRVIRTHATKGLTELRKVAAVWHK